MAKRAVKWTRTAEIEGFGASFGTEDFKEGTSAFLEKRKAEFPGK